METVTKYKLLKDLPDVKAGTVVQFFGLFDDEPYKSMIKESQYIPEIGWYWKSDIKTGKNDTVNFNQYCKCNYNVDTLPEWFAPYLFTAEDGDVFKGDNVYFINKDNEIITCYNAIGISQDFNKKQIFFFKRKKAEQYLESLKPKFKVGDIVVFEDYNNNEPYYEIFKITKFDSNFIYNEDITYQYSHIRLAEESEIIKYYEQQGWVKGVKFKSNGETCILDNLYFGHTGTLCVESTGFKRFGIEDCELIKEPNYPKSWDNMIRKEGLSGHSIESYIDKSYPSDEVLYHYSKGVFNTEKQAQSALAFAQLSQLHKVMIDEYNKVNNCDWKPDWTNEFNNKKYCVFRNENELKTSYCYSQYFHLSFPTKELAEFSLKHHESLWKQYYELD